MNQLVIQEVLKTNEGMIFMCLVLLHLFGELLIIHGKLLGRILRYLTKPFLMPALIYIYVSLTPTEASLALIVAILFSGVGDLFLLLFDQGKKQKYLSCGIYAYLIAHIGYIIYLSLQLRKGLWSVTPMVCACLVITLVIAGVGWKNILPYTGKLRNSTAIYIVIISCMSICSSLLLETQYLFPLGAIIFMLSDLSNAFNKFVHKFLYERLLTMSTYTIGQFLITIGAITLYI